MVVLDDEVVKRAIQALRPAASSDGDARAVVQALEKSLAVPEAAQDLPLDQWLALFDEFLGIGQEAAEAGEVVGFEPLPDAALRRASIYEGRY